MWNAEHRMKSCTVQKPHLGTDLLVTIVKNLRKKIEALGGEIRFRSALTGIHTEKGQLDGH